MLSTEMTRMLNDQINMELYSGYLYLEMATYYREYGLDGFAHWFEVQVQEEYDHAMLIRQYLINNDQGVELASLENPTTEFKDPHAPIKVGYDHEQVITASIHKIYDLAIEEKDYRTQEFLNWFIQEQAEEEANFMGLLVKYDLFARKEGNLYALDQEFAKRVHHPPSLELD